MKPTLRALSVAALPFGLALGFIFAAPACPGGGSPSAGCVTNADCPSTAVCSQGKCILTRGSGGNAAGGSSGGQASTTANQGTTGAGVNGGSSGGSSNGGSAGSTTSCPSWPCGGSSSGGSSSGGSGGSCVCSTSCCSIDEGSAPAGNKCPGTTKYCYGLVPDGGDFFCNLQNGKCDPFDPCSGASGTYTCQPTGGGNGGSSGAAATVDPQGLSFVVVGDTRPNSVGGAYPTQTIQQIYRDFSNLSPQPMAVVATGDFQEDGDTTSATTEIDDFESAIALYTAGPTYPAMGNHECVSTSITTYCAVGGYTTVNFDAFMQMLVDLKTPNTNGKPYYYETLTAPNGDTAKFVQTAAQAWDSTQVSWLTTTLAVPSTFTFLARHEPDDAVGCTNSTTNDNTTNSCPFIADVQKAINAAPVPVTLKLTGHTHEIRFDNQNDAIVSGAGGVAIESGCSGNSTNTTYCNYGYVYCQELTNKTFLCNAYDATSGLVTTPGPHIAANGAPNPGTLNYAN